MQKLTVDAVRDWINRSADEIDLKKAYLTDLDAPIGDSDHGANMARGFSAVKAKLAGEPQADIGALFKTVAMTLLSTVGGASGPLYSTFFLQAASKSAGKAELDLAGWTACLDAALAGVAQRGKAVVGEKTMVDALQPAVEALKHADGKELGVALASSAEAAQAGMKATIPLVARKGRASYLGERSAGHQDPGATSTHLLLKTLAETALR
jgi:phosphoenolpyruvate---glycerone phosphotransferase subunit DhaL